MNQRLSKLKATVSGNGPWVEAILYRLREVHQEVEEKTGPTTGQRGGGESRGKKQPI